MCSGEDLIKNDRISDLPDDILVRILSSLTLKEVGSISVLSRRWRHVWAYVPYLNFDNGDMFINNLRFRVTAEKRKEEELKYFRWVNQVVKSHKAYSIEEFMIRYDLYDSRKENIDDWITFAMKKRVKRLQLKMRPFKTYGVLPYTLPSLSPSNILTSLDLCGVDVSGKVLEKLLCDCPALESLSVTNSQSLVELKVAGPSLNLKSLTLVYVFKMEHLEIYAPNLISFEYFGPKISWPLISTPKLVQLSIGGEYGYHIKNDFSALSGLFSQIEVFNLASSGVGYDFSSPKPSSSAVAFFTDSFNNLCIFCIVRCLRFQWFPRVIPVFPVFRKLNILDMKLNPLRDVDLFRLGSFLKACPLLHKFGLEFAYSNDVEMTKKTRKFIAFHHPHLKFLEIRRFMGREIDIAFIIVYN